MSPRSRATRADDPLPDGEPTSIVRRAPFADSPFVGERGQKAQSKILEAALEVFGEVGYHGCGIKRITEVSGYSRASFYQYFSSKEDLFRHLAGRVARLLNESAALLDPVTGDQAGWDALRAWLDRYTEIYDAYEPVFVTFQTAVASDEMVASGSTVVFNRTLGDLRSKVVGSDLPPARIDTVMRAVLQTVARLNRETELIELVAPTSSLDRERANIAYADTIHRALFGVLPRVNVHTSTKRVKPLVRPALALADPSDEGDPSHGPVAQQTRAHLLDAGHQVFIERGYYATRVADIVKAAGVSHGVFYRYFENKTQLFRILAERASNELGEALDTFPDLFGVSPKQRSADLRGWLGRYADSYAAESSIFTMWSEAISREPSLIEVSAALIDASRVRLARGLSARGWGDAEADGLVLLVLVDAMTAHRGPPSARIEPIAEVIERGLLDGPSPGRRSSPNRASARKASSKKAPAERATDKKSVGKRSVGKRSVGKRSVDKKAPDKKAAHKNAGDKKAPAKKASSKKASKKAGSTPIQAVPRAGGTSTTARAAR
jgi:AcrR family transcriptional regulator